MKRLTGITLCALTFVTFVNISAIDHDPSASTGVLLIGDTGKDNEGQAQVSRSMQDLCAKEDCDLGVLAGDNVYPAGVESSTDPVMERMFDKHYNPLNIPFLIALGNHDYGTTTRRWRKGRFQQQHAHKNPAFYMPHFFYSYETPEAVFAVIDTTRLMWKKDSIAQGNMINHAYNRARIQNKWFLVIGHHPYLSNGKHGNVGNYDGVPWPHFVSGSHLKDFLDFFVCGKAHFYLSGHDHNLQVLDGKIKGCDTQLVVSGSGASSRSLSNRNKVQFETTELGYFHLAISQEVITLKAINHKTEKLFEKSYLKSINE